MATVCPVADKPHVWVGEDEALGALISSSKFEEAVVTNAAALVDLHRENWVVKRVINDRGQFTAALTMLDLHLADAGAGFVLADLREQARNHGFGSPNRVTALAGALRRCGFLAPVPAADSRLRKLAPTDGLIALYRQRFSAQLQAQALVRPQITPAIAALSEPAFLGSFAHGQLAFWRSGSPAARIDPGLEALGERANALVILYAKFVAEVRGTPLAISDLARQFSVARSHVISIMKESEAHGLMAFDRPARNFHSTARLRHALHLMFASTCFADEKAYEFALALQRQLI